LSHNVHVGTRGIASGHGSVRSALPLTNIHGEVAHASAHCMRSYLIILIVRRYAYGIVLIIIRLGFRPPHFLRGGTALHPAAPRLKQIVLMSVALRVHRRVGTFTPTIWSAWRDTVTDSDHLSWLLVVKAGRVRCRYRLSLVGQPDIAFAFLEARLTCFHF